MRIYRAQRQGEVVPLIRWSLKYFDKVLRRFLTVVEVCVQIAILILLVLTSASRLKRGVAAEINKLDACSIIDRY